MEVFMHAGLRKIAFFVGLFLFSMPVINIPAETAATAPDYSRPSNWVCQPGSDDVCTKGLDVKAVFPDGRMELRPFKPDADPAIDCFYVYPTISLEDRAYADLADSPEIQKVVKWHAGMLSSRCRVFAPLYRQATIKHLQEQLSGHEAEESDMPYQDVSAAWDYYLKHDNHGRGVVLLGHSQGSILLQRLMVATMDGKPQQSLLVAAFLAGDPSLGVPQGQQVGGTFQHIPICGAVEQTGCAYAWGSYLQNALPDDYAFGGARNDGLESACANPASFHGEDAPLQSILPRPSMAPETDPPFLETVDQLSGVCKAANGAHVFVVSVNPGQYAGRYMAVLQRAIHRAAWGLHPLDVGLVEGNILKALTAETQTWQKAHAR
jgi:hypothetical protein